MTKRQGLIVSITVLSILVLLCAVSLMFVGQKNDKYIDNSQNIEKLATNSGVLTDGEISDQITDLSDVPSGYYAIGGGSGRDFSFVRSYPGSKHILMEDITITSLNTGANFTGELDGNGHTIYIDASLINDGSAFVGGLFAQLSGKVYDLKIVVNKFRVGTTSNDTSAGIVAGQSLGGAYVDNVSITLKYSPQNLDNREDNEGLEGGCDFYLYQFNSRADESVVSLGGVFGRTNGNTTIRKTTVDNQADGYGFSVKGWRNKGSLTNHSDGHHYLGGFVGYTNAGNLTVEYVTLDGDYDSKFYIYNESTSNYRYNEGFFGGVVGYQKVGHTTVSGLIMQYPIRVNNKADGESVDYQNIKLVNMNWEEQACAGILVGWDENANTSFTAKNLYFLQGNTLGYDKAQDSWLSGKKNDIFGGITYFSQENSPVFDGKGNISYYGAKKVAPDSKELVYQIEHTGLVANVMSQLIASEGESTGLCYVTVPIIEHTTDGKTYTINLQKTMATQQSINLVQSNWQIGLSSDNSKYVASRLFNNQVPESPSIQFGSETIANAYKVDGVSSANVGKYTLNVDESKLAGRKLTTYNGITYAYDSNKGIVYVPSNIDGAMYDMNKPIELTIEKLPIEITLTASSGVEIVYGDTYEEVKEKGFNATIQGQAYHSIESWQLMGYSGTENAGTEVSLIAGNVLMSSNSTGNYEITYNPIKVVIAKKPVDLTAVNSSVAQEYDGTVMTTDALRELFEVNDEGQVLDEALTYQITSEYGQEIKNAGTYNIIAILDENSNYVAKSSASVQLEVTPMVVTGQFVLPPNAEYDGLQKEVDFVVDGIDKGDSQDLGILLGEDRITFKYYAGIQAMSGLPVDCGEYKVVAQLPVNELGKSNYAWGEGQAQEQSFVITQKRVEIVADTEKLFGHIYDASTFSDFESLYKIPADIYGNNLVLDISEKDGKVINDAGEYTIVAKLADNTINKNYIADAIENTYTVQKRELTITASSGNSVFNNTQKSNFDELFDISGNVEGQEIVLTYSVDGERQVLNEGEYTITATLADNDINKNYLVSQLSVLETTYTIDKITVDGELTAQSTLEYDGKAKSYKFNIAEGANMYGFDITIIYSYAQGDEEVDLINYTGKTIVAKAVLPEYEEGKSNFEFASSAITEQEFAIAKKTVVIGINEDSSVFSKTYDGQQMSDFSQLFVAPTDVDGLEMQLDIQSDSQVIDAGKYTITANIVDDTSNYTAEAQSVEFIVNKADPIVNIAIDGERFYDGQDMPSISLDSGSTDGTIKWQDGQYLISSKSDYVWEYEPSAENARNFNSKTGTYAIDVIAIDIISIEAELDADAKIFTTTTLEQIKEYLAVTGTNNDIYDTQLKVRNEDIQVKFIGEQSALQAGKNTLEVVYLENLSVKTTIIVNAQVPQLESIKAEFDAKGLIFYQNGAIFNSSNQIGNLNDLGVDYLKDYLTVKAYNDDGNVNESVNITSDDYTLQINLASLIVGENVVTVSYDKYTTTFILNISPKVLVGIEIIQAPIKKNYTAYDQMDLSGMQIKANFSDGTSSVLEEGFVVVGSDKMVVAHNDGMIVEYTYEDIKKTAVLTGISVTKLVVLFQGEFGDSSVVYSGEEYTYINYDSEYYSILDNTFVNAGSYVAKVVLNDKDNFIWGNENLEIFGTNADIEYEWEITKKKISLQAGGNLSKVYDGKTVSAEELKANFTAEMNLSISINYADGIKDAGIYSVTGIINDPNYTSVSAKYTYSIERASREIIATFDVGYTSIEVTLEYGLEDAQYSFDNKTWYDFESSNIAVDIKAQHTLYIRYVQSNNYYATAYKRFDLKISKQALYEYIQNNFSGEFEKSDFAKFEELRDMANNCYGESAEFDKAYAQLETEYNTVYNAYKEALESAMNAGSKLAGYTNGRMVAMSLTTVSTGLLAIGLCISARRQNRGKSKKALLSLIVIAILATVCVSAFAGCKEKPTDDNVAKALEQVSTLNNLQISVSEDGQVIYACANGATTTNMYSMVINLSELIGSKTDKNISLTKDNLASGYKFEYDSSSGEVVINAKLQNTNVEALNGADLVIKTNIKSGTTSQYTVTYTDAWGYDIKIDLV